MKKYILILMFLFTVSACQSPLAVPTSVTVETPAATRVGFLSSLSSAPSATGTVTPIPSPTVDLYAELHVRETALALDKAALDQQAQAAQVDQMNLNIQLTRDMATSYAVGTSTENANLNVIKTEVKGTQVAGTPTAAALTSTAYAPTQNAINQSQRANKIFTYGSRVLGLGFLGALAVLIVVGAWRFIETWQFNNTRMKPNERGQFDIVPSQVIPGKNGNLVNANLQHRVNSSADDLTAEEALQNKNFERMKEVEISKSTLGARAGKKTADEGFGLPMPISTIPISKPEEQIQLLLTQDADQIFNADWKIIENWDCKGSLIPYGVNKKGAAFVNIEENYHYGVFGATGEWKSRGFLRPFMAALLASGHRAIILGKTGDFWMFDSHPNVNLIAVRDVTEKTEARRYADYLKRMTREMNLRDEWLTSKHQSTWERAGRENTFIVLDEIGNALEQMPKTERDDCMRWIVSLVKQGRKNGFNVITASQRAVGFKNVVEQMSRVVYRLSDEMSSRIALGRSGAEYLPRNSGKFFSNFSNIELCGSFVPTDEQLIAFLHSRPVTAHEPMDWIDAVATEVEERKPEPTGRPISENNEKTPQAKIVDLWVAYLSKQEAPNLAEIERQVYGKTGGSYHNNVKKAIADFEGCAVDEVAGVIAQKIEEWQSATFGTTSGATTAPTTQKAVETGTL